MCRGTCKELSTGAAGPLRQGFNVMSIPMLMVLGRKQMAAQRAITAPTASLPTWQEASRTSRTRDAPASRRRKAVIRGRFSDQVTG
jgi:hypothetical protein